MLRKRSPQLFKILSILCFLFISSIAYSQALLVPIEDSIDNFEKSNQSKLFYHDGAWWVIAQWSDKTWHLWKYQNNTWVRDIAIDSENKSRPDCYMDSQNNKLYVSSAHTSNHRFYVVNYSNGSWSIPEGYPVEILDFSYSDDNVASFCVDQSGRIWIFRIFESVLQYVYSDDDGKTWTNKFALGAKLNVPEGLTDAVAFTEDGVDYIGVAYAENTASGLDSHFGFLLHKVSDPPTAWSSEKGVMGQFPDVHSDNHISALADTDGSVYIVVKTGGSSGAAADNGLYVRKNGTWRRYVVNSVGGWTRLSLAIDHTNNDLYVFGTTEGTPAYGVYKRVAIGSEELLDGLPQEIILQNGEDKFNNMSLPNHPVDETTGLMVAAQNKTDGHIWSGFLEINERISAIADQSFGTSPSDFGLVGVYPNPLKQDAITAGTHITAQMLLPAAQSANIFVYNMLGQRVVTLTDHVRGQQGMTQVSWNGKNAAGQLVPPGVYFLQVQTRQYSDTKKILILR